MKKYRILLVHTTSPYMQGVRFHLAPFRNCFQTISIYYYSDRGVKATPLCGFLAPFSTRSGLRFCEYRSGIPVPEQPGLRVLFNYIDATIRIARRPGWLL